ncbi:MAG: ATP-grasp domain-containing protein [Gammaproteobacteria bacterium]
MTKRCVGLIDPFVDAARIVKAFAEHNVECFSILTSVDSLENLDNKPILKKMYHPELFTQQFFLSKDEKAIEKITSEPQCIGLIVCCEIGIAKGDPLIHKLSPQHANPLKTTEARFNKIAYYDAAYANGLLKIKHAFVTQDNYKDAVKALDDKIFPVVLKPAKCAGSFGVAFCANKEDILASISKTSVSTDLFGNVTDSFVIQKHYHGDEYVVDAVNFSGEHYIVAVYRKETDDKSPLYQSATWIDPETEEAKTIINYTVKLLEAINFDYGPAHMEIILTEDGPKIIDMNPRLSGSSGFYNDMCEYLTHKNQANLMVDLYLGNAIDYKIPYENETGMFTRFIYLINLGKPARINQATLDEIYTLPSFKKIKFLNKDIVPTATDKLTIAGMVMLLHEDALQLANDYARIVELQNSTLFIPV